MPCYDKKLEASREDFYDEVRPRADSVVACSRRALSCAAQALRARDVDLVLSSEEIVGMLAAKGIDLRTVPESPLDSLFTHASADAEVRSWPLRVRFA
jgi:iron only hydrogenase large subunit-like protein